MSTTERDWIEEVGKPAYEAIAEMVAALQADRERLEELRDERQAFQDEVDAISHSADIDEDAQATISALAKWNAENAEELRELIAAVTMEGEEIDEEAARERILEDALSLRIFGERDGSEWTATNYELLLTTGGPAVRIVGDIDGDEASSARLEVQDWGKPWSEYFNVERSTLLAYANCFYFGE